MTSEFGEQFTEAAGPILPLDHYPGDGTTLQILGAIYPRRVRDCPLAAIPLIF